MICHFKKTDTAADILPFVPPGKELRQIKETDVQYFLDEIKAFLLLHQPRLNRQAIKAYEESNKP